MADGPIVANTGARPDATPCAAVANRPGAEGAAVATLIVHGSASSTSP